MKGLDAAVAAAKADGRWMPRTTALARGGAAELPPRSRRTRGAEALRGVDSANRRDLAPRLDGEARDARPESRRSWRCWRVAKRSTHAARRSRAGDRLRSPVSDQEMALALPGDALGDELVRAEHGLAEVVALHALHLGEQADGSLLVVGSLGEHARRDAATCAAVGVLVGDDTRVALTGSRALRTKRLAARNGRGRRCDADADADAGADADVTRMRRGRGCGRGRGRGCGCGLRRCR